VDFSGATGSDHDAVSALECYDTGGHCSEKDYECFRESARDGVVQ
jgi:hypothetical protein